MSAEVDPPEPAHRRPDGVFFNPWFPGEPRAGGMVRWMWQRLTRPLPAQPDPSVFPLALPAFASPRARPGELLATWIGHASVLLQSGGLNVLTDPVFSRRASPFRFLGPARWVVPGIGLDELPPLDIVLLSHNHYDHLDVSSVRALAARCPAAVWLVPLGVGRLLRSLGVRHLEECDWWESREVSGATITCTPAAHFSARTPFDRNRTLWCGWAVTAGGFRIYFAGDTGWHPEFPRIASRAGPFDLALLPIGAYEPRWFMRPVHLDPEEAVQACTALGGPDGRPPVMLPIHWGTFRLTDEPMDEPPRRVRAAWVAQGHPPERLRVPRHGETVRL